MAKQKFNFQLPSGNTEPFSPSQVPADVPSLVERLAAPQKEKSFEVKMIPRKKIRTNKKNDYAMEDIESLRQSILYFGLNQPLKVIYLIGEDMYCIEAGHRRTAALDSLIQEYSHNEDADKEIIKFYNQNVKMFEKGYPCVIGDSLHEDYDYDADTSNLDDTPEEIIDSEIRLHITNLEVRDINPVLKAEKISRLAKLYEQKNRRLPSGKKIAINKKIAQELNISERQVINYKRIEKLIPEFQEAFKQNIIPLSECSQIAQMTDEEQRNLWQQYQTPSQEVISIRENTPPRTTHSVATPDAAYRKASSALKKFMAVCKESDAADLDKYKTNLLKILEVSS